MMHRKGGWIQTFTGIQFYPLDPREEDVELDDIAHSLSMIPRYNGHTKKFYSVAEHSILLSNAVAPQHALWALFHDAAEAYLIDVTKPVKSFLFANIHYHGETSSNCEVVPIKTVENRILRVIADKVGLTWPPDDMVNQADQRIVVDEKNQAYANNIGWDHTRGIRPLNIKLHFWSPEEAKKQFLARWAEIRELMQNCIRTSGDMICEECDQQYRNHPHDPHMLSGIDGQPFLRVACNGQRLKL
jgi:hypothetical protein